MKSIAPESFISIYPPKGHQSKRAGPLITIRTSTFVELLGHAREWDAKYPALAGASRAYLIESFAFADSFCSYAGGEQKSFERAFLRFWWRWTLFFRAALFLALLVPFPSMAQSPANIVFGADCQTYGPQWCFYYVQNIGDSDLGLFILYDIPISVGNLFQPEEPNSWLTWAFDQGDGMSTAQWAALPENAIPPGGARQFWLSAWGATGVTYIGYLVGGEQAASWDATIGQQ